jgi:hypothetical protein
MGMKITGATICDEVAIDGNEYDGCTFNQAVLVYSGGAHPSFHNCALNGCTVRFSGAAERTLRLMRSFSTSELKQVAQRRETRPARRTRKPALAVPPRQARASSSLISASKARHQRGT